MSPQKKPRVLMLYDFPIKGGGSGSYVKYLAMRLQEAYKYEVAIAAPDWDSSIPNVKIFPIKLPQIPVYISRPGLEREKRYSELSKIEIADLYHAYIKETMRVVDEFHPDIIHVHHIMINAWTARFIRSLYGTKVVVTCHGSCLYAVMQDRRYFRMTRDALRAAHAITVVSGDTRAKLIKTFGKDLSLKTRTIPGGVRLSVFPAHKATKDLSNKAQELRANYGKIVLFTGRLISEKGLEYLLKAASRIKGQVVIAGEGPQRQKLQEMIKSMKLENVTLTGYIPHDLLIDYYYAADVFVSPAVWDDPMPLTVIEAMAARLPVVVTRKGGMSLAVKDGINGFFVGPRNAADIAEKVNRLLLDKELSQKMGDRARAVVVERFTWRHIAQRFHSLYRNL